MRALIFATALLCLTGCATNYQSASFWGNGYTSYRIAEDTHSITFRGNQYTTKERAEQFAMLRAAELTLESGYTHFLVLEQKDRSSVVLERYDSAPLSGDDSSIVALCDLFTPDSRTSRVESPRITLHVRCLEGSDCAGAICAEEYIRYNRED